MVRVPVDVVGLATLWATCDVPRQTVVAWARFLEADDGERVVALFDAMGAAPGGRAN
jgi:hypothetical protein